MNKARLAFFILLMALVAGLAQRRRGGFWSAPGGGDTGIVYTEWPNGVAVDVDRVRTAREIANHQTETPTWTNPPGFERDVLTFTRTIYRRGEGRPGSQWGWITDFPDSDLNLSYRLQQMTAIKTSPDGRVVRLTDPALFDYPWIYMVEPGSLEFKPEEIEPLRKYLHNGGVLWADDFWGTLQWDNFAHEMKRVLPEGQFVDLDMTNKIFHSVFDLKVPMNKLQTPNIRQGTLSLNPQGYEYGVTWEYHDGEECKDMHVRAIYDDKNRIMVLATHNCDNGDGWEREGADEGFFHEFSEKRAYPLGFNVLFYLMTH
jgi:hypothetical protein